MDFTKAIEIAPKLHWVGMYLENDPFQCHPYFIENGEASVLVDPGSMLEFEAVVKKVNIISSMKNIKYIILHHQDPDLAAAVPEMEKLIARDDLLVVTHSRMVPLVKHYMITSAYYEIDKHDLKLQDGDLELQFTTTPYCHSPGAFVSYEPKTKTLFSGDIFGGIEESWEFYAQSDYFDKAKQFHAEYMPSKDIFNYALSKIEQLDLERIAPQHGSIILKQHIKPLIKQMKALECGLYIEDEYHNQLTSTIEALKKKDLALLESLSHFQILMDTMHEAVVVSSKEGYIIDLNAAAEHIFGYTKTEFKKIKLMELVDPASFSRCMEAIDQEQIDPFEIRLLRAGEKSFPALVGGRNSYRDSDEVRITTMIDLSELKEKEELLFQKAKMADMGEMIGNIAHQWRQPLAMVNMLIALLKEKNHQEALESKELDKKLNEMETNVQYMSNTINDFMSFYRPNKSKERFELSSAVQQAMKIVHSSTQKIAIDMQFHCEEPLYGYGFINEYTQALVSILTNAKDILIERQIELPKIEMRLYEDHQRAILEIEDNGGGIQDGALHRIFEPYFSSKHKSMGTGLGLYISKMIIEKSMQGALFAQNRREGAMFTIEMEVDNG